jgi:hypothetical protein
MRRYSMPERVAWQKLRPSNPRAWHQIRLIGSYLLVILLFTTTVFFFKNKHRDDLDRNWSSATALIEDVRSQSIEQVESVRGGAMLYEVVVLAKYNSDGSDRERWITVDQRPVPLAEAELQAFRWKGKQCVVRWKASKPDRVIAEIS